MRRKSECLYIIIAEVLNSECGYQRCLKWDASLLLLSAMAGRLYKLQSKHTSNSGLDQTFMPCSGYILFAAEQRVGYQISRVDLQREVNCP